MKEIDSKTPEEYVKSIINSQYLEYDFKRKKLKLDSLLIRDNNKPVSLKLVTPYGKIIKKDIQEMKELHFAKYNDYKNFISLIIQKNKVAYMKLKYINEPTIISPNESVGFKGKIYLLVDDDVYSASESFAAFAKATKWATLVGTTTGGDGIGIAPPGVMALPNSKLAVTFSMNMGINPDGTANEETYTTPDIYVEQNSKDFTNCLKWQKSPDKDNSILNPYDSVLNSVLEIIKNH